MKLINPNELMANLYMEYGDKNGGVDIQAMLSKLEDEINACQDWATIVHLDPTVESVTGSIKDM